MSVSTSVCIGVSSDAPSQQFAPPRATLFRCPGPGGKVYAESGAKVNTAYIVPALSRKAETRRIALEILVTAGLTHTAHSRKVKADSILKYCGTL